MPGSPAISSTEPRTNRPPVTRSSSGTPDGSRGASWASPASGWSANTRPLRAGRPGPAGDRRRCRAGRAGPRGAPAAPSSAIVFLAPQASHLPAQRPYTAPQFWQMKEGACLAISLISVRQRFEWVGVTNADGPKVAHIGGEQEKAVALRRCTNRDIGEAGV